MRRLPACAMLVAAALAFPAGADGEVRTQVVEYRHGEIDFEGFLAYDDGFDAKRPGVLVVHEWWGLNDFARGRARRLAEMGYVAFAADLYGKGVRADNAAVAARLAAPLRKDRQLMRRRTAAALRVLAGHGLVDEKKLAAIGYCFGGTAVLELARSGADVRAVVSFHGGLSTPEASDARRIRAKVLVLHGAEDPRVPPAEVAAFQKEMRSAGADWQMVVYGGAVHAFTNPASGSDPSTGAAYDARAARRAWAAMQLLLGETIGLPQAKAAPEPEPVAAPEPQERGGALGTVGRALKTAGKATGKAVTTAGKATGKAVKRAAVWTYNKVTGKWEKKSRDD